MKSAKVKKDALGIKNTASKSARSARSAKSAASKSPENDDGFDLSTEPSKEMLDRLDAIKEEEAQNPIGDDEWNEFFYVYLKYIEENIGVCLKALPTGAPLKVLLSKSQTLAFLKGGYDNELNKDEKLDENIGYYNLLFSDFKDGTTNKLNGCVNINLLLKYVGYAVLKLAENHKKNSDNELIEFYRKIAIILELAVYPEIFLFYFEFLKKTTPIPYWYKGIWIRKQEYLGVIPKGEKRNYDKKFDTGLTRFVRNYIRRAIVYTRIQDVRKNQQAYPFAYENPYNLSPDPIIALQNPPLPLNGVYIYKDPDDDYHISSDDWKYIPDFLLPNNDLHTQVKEYKKPSEWNKPPPDWWIERTKTLLGFCWWTKRVNIDNKRKELEGTKKLAKWKQLNGILPGNYNGIAIAWDGNYEEYDNKGFVDAVAADDAEADAIAAKVSIPTGGNRSKSKSKANAKAETANKDLQLKKTPKIPKTPKTPKTPNTPKTPTKSSRKPRLSTAARAFTV